MDTPKEEKILLIKRVYLTFYYKFFSFLLKILNVVMVIIIISVLTVLILNKTERLHLAIFAIESESMEPNLQKGDLIIVQRNNEYSFNEIVTYKPNEEDNKTITHRIVKVENNTQDVNIYTLKGDNNPSNDPYQVSNHMIIGKVIKTIPQLGYAVLFIRTVSGVISMLIIPATMLFTINAYDLFISLKKNYKKNKLY